MLNVDVVAAALYAMVGDLQCCVGVSLGTRSLKSSQYGDRALIPVAATLALLLDLQGTGMR